MLNDSSDSDIHRPDPQYEHGPIAELAPPHKRAQLTEGTVPWGPWTAVFYALVVYFVAQLGGSLLVILYPKLMGWSGARAEHWLNTTIVAQFWFVLLTEILTFGATWWFIAYRGGRLRMVGWRGLHWKDPLRTAGAFVVYFFVYAMLLQLAKQLFPGLNLEQKQDLGFSAPASDSSLLLTYISLVVLPPLVEEFVFRGFLYSGMRTKLKPVLAALVTSAIFATAHLEIGNGKPLMWVAALDTFTLSLVLCYLREKTSSLWPGIMLHALKNCIAFISLYLVGR